MGNEVAPDFMYLDFARTFNFINHRFLFIKTEPFGLGEKKTFHMGNILKSVVPQKLASFLVVYQPP